VSAINAAFEDPSPVDGGLANTGARSDVVHVGGVVSVLRKLAAKRRSGYDATNMDDIAARAVGCKAAI